MKTRKAGNVWFRGVAIGAGVVAVGTAASFGVLSSQYVPKALPGTVFAGAVDLSGMTEEEAGAAVDAWWAEKQAEEIRFAKGRLEAEFPSVKLGEAGVSFDRDEVLEQIQYDTFWEDFRQNLGQDKQKGEEIGAEFAYSASMVDELASFVAENQPPVREAQVKYSGGDIKRVYGSAGMEFDPSRLTEAVQKAVEEGVEVEIPVKEAPKRISDAQLDKIKAVVSEFTTKFNAGQVSRSANIKLAAEKIDGLILLPGESFSFNDHLGQRTTAKGYKAAGVYVNGRHDIDVGGGICQVSTTLYGAVLKGEMKVDRRFPHSLPVPYVPLGLDAAVSYPNPDLKFTNNFETPIALSATYGNGQITFRILGERVNPREIKFETKFLSSWSHGEKLVHDPSLAPGVRKVVDKGGTGRKVQTWKVVYENGVEVERIDLGQSSYRGGPVIVAINKNASAASDAGSAGTAEGGGASDTGGEP